MYAARLASLAIIAALFSHGPSAAKEARFHILCEGQLKYWQNSSGYGEPSKISRSKLVVFFRLKDDVYPNSLMSYGDAELRLKPDGHYLSGTYSARAHMSEMDIVGDGRGENGRSYMFDRTLKTISYWGVFGRNRDTAEMFDGECVVERNKGLGEYK